MHPFVRFRNRQGWSQEDLAKQLRLKSRAQIADIERGRQRPSAELAIAADRLSGGHVSVAELRPDLHDVRVLHPHHSGTPA